MGATGSKKNEKTLEDRVQNLLGPQQEQTMIGQKEKKGKES